MLIFFFLLDEQGSGKTETMQDSTGSSADGTASCLTQWFTKLFLFEKFKKN